MQEMQTIVIDGSGVCQSFVTRLHMTSLCKHGSTDEGTAWSGDSWKLREHCCRQESGLPHGFDVAITNLLWPLDSVVYSLVCCCPGTRCA